MCICDHCAHCGYVSTTRYQPEELFCAQKREEWDEEPQDEEDCEAFLDSNLAAEEEYWARYALQENNYDRYEE